MKRLILSFILTLFLSPVLQAQDITPVECTQAIQYLESTRAGVVAATKGLSEAQWNFKPATNRWSIAEVTEHLAAAEDFLMDMVTNKVMKAPARTGTEDVKAIDDMVLHMVPDRSHKIQAPEPLLPSNRFGSPKASRKHFRASRTQTIAFLKNTTDLRQHAIDSPLGKPLDGYEWILLIAAHSERHTKQIDEVKADPNYPKQ